MRTTRRALASALLVLTGPVLLAQNPWVKQAPIPTGGNCWGVSVLSPDDVWASGRPYLGNQGEAVHTTDGGETWSVTSLGNATVNTIFFVDAQHGWAAGNAFRHTTDGGQTWIQDNSWGSIYDLFFLDTQRGWACGNGSVTYRTVDGGLTWAAISAPGGTTLSSIFFLDAQNGWCVAIGGNILRTTDGGLSWTVNHASGEYLSTIQFLSPTEGWAIGGDTFLHTTDGGQTWSQAGVPAGTWSHGAHFHDAQRGVSVGEYGNIVRTVDGGQTWETIEEIGAGPRLWDVEWADANTVVLSGDAGVLKRSTDAGATWTTIQNGAQGITSDLQVLDPQTAWVANQGGEVASTTDGGKHWVRHAVDGFDTYGNIYGVGFADADRGWAAGENEYFGGSDGRISRTDDGGETWTLQVNVPDAEFFGVNAVTDQIAIAYGRTLSGSAILRTTNGGATWGPSSISSQGGFRDAFFLDATTGWLVGSDIFKTTDAGASWTLQHANGVALAAVSFADAQHGWAVGFAKEMLYTADGGTTWVHRAAPGPAGTAYTGVTAVGPTTAWITGWYGTVARTTDAGQTWQVEVPPGGQSATFEEIAFVTAEHGWVVGDAGIWVRGADGPCAGVLAYCASTPNSTGAPAKIGWTGSCAVADDDFTLTAGPVPNQTFLFLYGDAPQQVPFGSGFLCIAGTLKRVNPPGAASGNVAARTLDLGALGFASGDTVYFQCWFRDGMGGQFNTSDGLEVTFE